MEDELVKKSVSLPAWMWVKLTAYQHASGCLSQSEALRRLIANQFGERSPIKCENEPAQ